MRSVTRSPMIVRISLAAPRKGHPLSPEPLLARRAGPGREGYMLWSGGPEEPGAARTTNVGNPGVFVSLRRTIKS